MEVKEITAVQATQRVVSENDYRLLRLLKAAQESGRVLVNYPADGKVTGWAFIFNGKDTRTEETLNG